LQSIGSRFNKNESFTEHVFDVDKEDVICHSSDGYCDQPDANSRSFGSRKFTKLLDSIG